MVIRHRRFTTRDRLRKKYKPKGIVALYYYYRYLIKLYTRNNTQYKLTPKMREEVKKMDEYSERIRFLCKYKIETLSDIDNVKEKKQEELQKILNARNRLYYKRQKLDNESEKDSVTKEIIEVASVLTKVRKEIKLCDEINDNVPRMKEQIKELDDKEKQRIKEKEQEKLGWNAKRELAKVNYRIHTDAIKENLIPKELTSQQTSIIYASEADVLNVALFVMTSKQWRENNPDLKGNIRDYASINELICLSNMENINAVLIEDKVSHKERFIKLNKIAIHQMMILEEKQGYKYLK